MLELFAGGQAVTLDQVLTNREWRSAVQQQLEADFPDQVVVAVKLNIAGPIKNSPKIQQVFSAGWQVIKRAVVSDSVAIKKVHVDDQRITGPEAFLVLDGQLKKWKQELLRFEEEFVLGRLFDCDVMADWAEGYQFSRRDLGLPPRRCLVCDGDAKVCAKEGRHPLATVQAASNQLYRDYFVTDLTLSAWSQDFVVDAAVAACLQEVVLAPKPGLVDPISAGAHHDMTVMTFVDSAVVLRPYFEKAFELGQKFSQAEATKLLAALRPEGVKAEQAMYLATDGVNTHKGAIFTLGILIAAYGLAIQDKRSTTLQTVLNLVQKISANVLDDDLVSPTRTDQQEETAGHYQYRTYQLTGVRGEVAAGLPSLAQVGLPTFRDRPGSVTNRFLDTLMALAGAIQDSTLIKRAQTPAIVQQMQDWVAEFFALGGAETVAGQEYLTALNQTMIEQNLSIGGAADYLILTIFISRLSGLLS
ncbi:triphosphoribosyl-dephospho-CoA synthase CitG [Fructobacillus evanidus]|uniref:Probable 2-(5''-triphosphoribosyl)-3'-dephosphocoenzyme-A synthase n=1 Tax=Fructobacillus evanidus TaxID=3064281 RepID=A0ABN9YIG1_9LACO|nr:Phosphoribosyl-dephospho-CoA transferase (holo-ACP synthetase) (CitX) [Fructobacillus sp. LMG 32999]CAK1222363.1 Phosphoribosyl-dephospho-CoA transferase (holo-ACP synthetase) (CitX) [Fructobacillus sp. LMG 32999]CAK1224890.1 Phosphoribosyl-dephospho-CoA transferase (holo-ACP synthetase) (CitX) [Fructobacillus sp. LMG 32999]CAK1225086.1 Phosphoribosyl-dephospho-CoA transferase (holo-ACP synthetase) (CitX) [Fructobacillus sp. LMG 32999]CAK1225261.1 Phosphoribosyl-dephospho-CoA transferase (ho